MAVEFRDDCLTCVRRKHAARVATLEAALRPFALFAERFDAKPIRGIADEVYGIHGGDVEPIGASLRLSDCRKARKALLGEDQ